MKKILILLTFPVLLFAQTKPTFFDLNKKNSFEKISETSANTPLSNSINDILVQGNGDTVWIATSKGLSVTFDKGTSWKNYYGDNAFGTESAIALEYSNGVIYVTTGHHEEGIDGSPVITGSGLRFSTDGGVTWVKVPQSVDDPSDSLITYGINTLRALPITVTQQNVSYDIAVLNDTIYTTSWAGGLRRVSLATLIANPNAQWERVVLPPDYLDSISPNDTLHFSLQPKAGAFGPEEYLNHVAFSVVATDSGYLYVGTANGINKSTDGISWRKFNYQNQIDGISGNFITSLGYDEVTHSVWATTWQAVDPNEYNAVSASFNGGETWYVFLDAIKGHGFGFVNKTDASEILVATDDGIFRTADYGSSWFVPSEIRDLDNNAIFDRFVNYYSCDASFDDAHTSTIWVGSSQGLAKETEEAGAAMWDGEWKLYIASKPLANADETYAFPNPFNPTLRQVKIKYEVKNDGTPVTVRIHNFDMQIVRTIIQNAPRNSGEQIETWDGRNENGIYVSNGVYFYVIQRGDNDKIYGKIMVIR
jgi:hypothetical protein